MGEESCGRISPAIDNRRRTPVSRRSFRFRPSKIYCCQVLALRSAYRRTRVRGGPRCSPILLYINRDWRLVAVILGLAPLVVLFAVMWVVNGRFCLRGTAAFCFLAPVNLWKFLDFLPVKKFAKQNRVVYN